MMYEGKSIKYLLENEKTAFFHAITEDNCRLQKRNLAIFLLACYCGLRASEIGLIRLSDVNMERREIYIRRLKGSNNNTLRIIDADVYSALKTYLSYRKQMTIQSDILFLSQKGTPISRKRLDELIKKYCAAAGIPAEKAHMHVLKHTCAISLAEHGLDTKDVQFWIGHKSINNTEIYLQFTTSQQEALYQKLALSSGNRQF